MCLGFTDCVAFDSTKCTDCYSGSRDCPGIPIRFCIKSHYIDLRRKNVHMCLSDVQCSVIGRCQGILIEDVVASSNEECLQMCQDKTECQWITYDYDNSNCIQLEDCQVLDETCDQCLSSQRHCSGEESSSKSILRLQHMIYLCYGRCLLGGNFGYGLSMCNLYCRVYKNSNTIWQNF